MEVSETAGIEGKLENFPPNLERLDSNSETLDSNLGNLDLNAENSPMSEYLDLNSENLDCNLKNLELNSESLDLNSENLEYNSENLDLNLENPDVNLKNLDSNSENQDLNSGNRDLNSRNSDLNSRSQDSNSDNSKHKREESDTELCDYSLDNCPLTSVRFRYKKSTNLLETFHEKIINETLLTLSLPERINFFSACLNSTVVFQMGKLNKKNLPLAEVALAGLERALENARHGLRKRVDGRRRKGIVLECSCSGEVNLIYGMDAWPMVQSHGHLEEDFVRSLAKRTEVLSRDDLDNGMEMNGTIMDDEISENSPSTSVSSSRLNLYEDQTANIPVFQIRGNSSVLCLSCSIWGNVFVPLQGLEEHAKGSRHQSCLSRPKVQVTLKDYHEFWRRKPEFFQNQQQYFNPLNKHQLYCSKCDQNVAYYMMIKHLKSQQHKSAMKKMDNSFTKNSVSATNQNMAKSQSNAATNDKSQSIAGALQSAKRNFEYLKLHPLKSNAIQFRTNHYYCLPCNRRLGNTLDVKSHLAGAKHKTNTRENKSFASYEKFWAAQDNGVQEEQIHFNVVSTSWCFCNLCKMQVHYEDVYYHLKHSKKHGRNSHLDSDSDGDSSDLNGSVIMKSKVFVNSDALGAKNNALQKPPLDMEINNLKGTCKNMEQSLKELKEIVAPMLNDFKFNFEIKKENTEGPVRELRDIEKGLLGKRVEDKLENIVKEDMDKIVGNPEKKVDRNSGNQNGEARGNPNKIQDVPGPSTTGVNDFKFNFPLETELDNSIENSKNIENEERENPQENKDPLRNLYLPGKKVGLPNAETFPYVQVTKTSRGQNYRCLLCLQDFPTLSVAEEHETSSIHKSNMASCAALPFLETFHNFWRTQTEAIKQQQIYFQPLNLTSTTCNICAEKVMYVFLEIHINTEKHFSRSAKAMIRAPDNDEIDDSASDSDFVQFDETAPKPVQNANGAIKKPLKGKQTHRLVPAGNSNAPGILGLLGNRFKEHLKFLKQTSEGGIICTCCAVTFEAPSLYDILSHLDLHSHRTNSGLERVRYKLLCGICNKLYSREASFYDHMAKCILNVPVKEHPKCKQYECAVCEAAIFANGNEQQVHNDFIKFWGRKKKKKTEVILSTKVKHMLGNKELEKTMDKLLNDAEVLLNSNDRMTLCCQSLEATIREIYPACKAYPFGSRVTGLGNLYSDLDVFIDIGGMFAGNKYQGARDQKDLVFRIASVLHKHGAEYKDINPIHSARTPIVQVFHVKTNIDCDLSFRHGLSVENTRYISRMLEMRPSLRTLILFLKHWLSNNRLKENITTYALTMMVIFLQQIQGKLPSLQTVKDLNMKGGPIDGWDTVIYSATKEQMSQWIEVEPDNKRDLLLSFFNFYTNFNYAKDVVCPLLGQTVKKEIFSRDPGSLPLEMESYTRKLLQSPDAEKFRNASAMCVQDPFDQSHNLTKSCSSAVLAKFKKLCSLSADFLKHQP